MTETSPLATISTPTAEVAAMAVDAQIAFKTKQGRLMCGLELKLVDDAGARLPHDGETPGRLLIRGPTITSGYFGGEGGEVLDAEGFFDTGDVATIDAARLHDRSPTAPRTWSSRAANGSARSRSRTSPSATPRSTSPR